MEKLWGYASNNGRQIKEGHVPSLNEATMVVGHVASFAAYLVAERKK
jgi:hypothetical protein